MTYELYMSWHTNTVRCGAGWRGEVWCERTCTSWMKAWIHACMHASIYACIYACLHAGMNTTNMNLIYVSMNILIICLLTFRLYYSHGHASMRRLIHLCRCMHACILTAMYACNHGHATLQQVRRRASHGRRLTPRTCAQLYDIIYCHMSYSVT